MKYILNENIALRSWKDDYFGYIRKNDATCVRLDIWDFLFLKQCDGRRDLAETPLLEKLTREQVIRPAAEGELLSPWQEARRYDNLFFPEINWMLTGKCNYNCLHCFNAADNAPLQAQWSMAEAEKLLDEAADCGVLRFTLTGGEPMLHPGFRAVYRGIYERNMAVNEINTNAYFINEDLLEEMKAAGSPLPTIKISFDGIGHHDWMRDHPGAEQRTLEAIRLTVRQGFRVKVQMNVHRGNVKAMLPTLLALDGLGVQVTRIIRTSESLRWLENAPDMTLTLEEYFDSMIKLLRDYTAQQHRMNLDIWLLASVNLQRKCYQMRAIRCLDGEYSEHGFACPGVRVMPAVTADGEIMPCMQCTGYYEAHGIHLGNVKKSGLKAVLNADAYLNTILRTVGDVKRSVPQCAACKWFEYCCGGCRVLARAIGHDSDHPDPSKCLFFEKDYYQKMKEALANFKNLAAVPALDR